MAARRKHTGVSYSVRKAGVKGWAIVQKKIKTGKTKVVGYSRTRKMAENAARFRAAVEHGWKPPR